VIENVRWCVSCLIMFNVRSGRCNEGFAGIGGDAGRRVVVNHLSSLFIYNFIICINDIIPHLHQIYCLLLNS